MMLLLRVLFSVVFMMLLQVYLAEPLPRTANYSYANKCNLEKELLMVTTETMTPYLGKKFARLIQIIC